jgi:predicted  nucleic acid-binding Zn-ribbon protein
MDESADVVRLERVRCLECGTTYAKPADGGMVNENPGCPRCGYLGWIRTTVPTPEDGRHRSGGDQPPPAAARLR